MPKFELSKEERERAEQVHKYGLNCKDRGKIEAYDKVIAYLKRKELNYGKSNFSRSAIRYITKLLKGALNE